MRCSLTGAWVGGWVGRVGGGFKRVFNGPRLRRGRSDSSDSRVVHVNRQRVIHAKTSRT